jgi:hypothetical protein
VGALVNSIIPKLGNLRGLRAIGQEIGNCVSKLVLPIQRYHNLNQNFGVVLTCRRRWQWCLYASQGTLDIFTMHLILEGTLYLNNCWYWYHCYMSMWHGWKKSGILVIIGLWYVLFSGHGYWQWQFFMWLI